MTILGFLASRIVITFLAVVVIANRDVFLWELSLTRSVDNQREEVVMIVVVAIFVTATFIVTVSSSIVVVIVSVVLVIDIVIVAAIVDVDIISSVGGFVTFSASMIISSCSCFPNRFQLEASTAILICIIISNVYLQPVAKSIECTYNYH